MKGPTNFQRAFRKSLFLIFIIPSFIVVPILVLIIGNIFYQKYFYYVSAEKGKQLLVSCQVDQVEIGGEGCMEDFMKLRLKNGQVKGINWEEYSSFFQPADSNKSIIENYSKLDTYLQEFANKCGTKIKFATYIC